MGRVAAGAARCGRASCACSGRPGWLSPRQRRSRRPARASQRQRWLAAARQARRPAPRSRGTSPTGWPRPASRPSPPPRLPAPPVRGPSTAAGTNPPGAYQFSGSHWTKRSFPGKASDFVTSASASSTSNVWAFTFDGAVLRYNGHAWSQVKKFGREVDSGLTVSSSDAWVFGSTLGTWHYDGHGWTRMSTAAGMEGASALSASSIWAFGGTRVAHWNGHAWLRTNLASLLPTNTSLSHSFWRHLRVVGDQCLGRRYRRPPGRGRPAVLLHYNGHAWSRVAGNARSATRPDRRRRPRRRMDQRADRLSRHGTMEHYTGGKLSNAKLPCVARRTCSCTGRRSAKGSTAPLAIGVHPYVLQREDLHRRHPALRHLTNCLPRGPAPGCLGCAAPQAICDRMTGLIAKSCHLVTCALRPRSAFPASV